MFEYLVFSEEQAFQGKQEIRIEVDGSKLRYRLLDETLFKVLPDHQKETEGVYSGDADDFISRPESFDAPLWKDEYYVPACDGYSWELRYKEVGRPCRKITGSNDSPDCYEDFVDLLLSVTRDE